MKSISLFSGYSANGLRLGIENDTKTISNLNESITSISTNYSIKDNIDVFVRFDMYDPDTNVDKNNLSYLITGVVFNYGNGLSMSPNMRKKTFEDSNNDEITEYKINFQFKF